MKRFIIALGLSIGAVGHANAVTCTWTGGTASWNNSNTANWSCGHVPTTSDTVVFDGTSGGGTVTVDSPNGVGVVTVQSITMGAFTGTLDFSANNNSVTLTSSTAFSNSGAAVRTLNLGNGTWTMTGAGASIWDMSTITNLTFNANSSTLLFTTNSLTARTATLGAGRTYNIITIAANPSGGSWGNAGGQSNTITTLNVTGPNIIRPAFSGTMTLTNLNVTSTAITPVMFRASSTANTATIASSSALSMSWAMIRDITFSGAGSLTFNNSLNNGNNSNITVNAPTSIGGGGGCILGGWLLWRDMPQHLNDNFPAWLDKAV